ncbi:hypothetical protein BSL78_02158, partial [Apostichopus japonicus]
MRSWRKFLIKMALIESASLNSLDNLDDVPHETEGELVGRTQETRNWGGMIISIIVIILICATIVTVAVIVSE